MNILIPEVKARVSGSYPEVRRNITKVYGILTRDYRWIVKIGWAVGIGSCGVLRGGVGEGGEDGTVG